jgi:hypothetical protein
MLAKSDPREAAVDSYYYRRPLNARQLLPAIGVGVAAGTLAFYVTRILLQRTPVTAEGLVQSKRRRSVPRVLPGQRAG